MQVRDRLARVRAVVDHEAEAVGELEFFCDQLGDVDEVAEDVFVVRSRLGHARNGPLRNDEQMNRRLRLDVVEDDAVFILVLDFRGDFAVDDFLEKGLGHGG